MFLKRSLSEEAEMLHKQVTNDKGSRQTTHPLRPRHTNNLRLALG